MSLSHFDENGAAQMVDVSDKPETLRIARARGQVRMRPETLELIRSSKAGKGDVLGTARLAGIMAAKRTSELIPLCHPLALSSIKVEFETAEDPPRVGFTTEVRCSGPTGVEMEALTACAVVGLTIYDMVKAVDRSMSIGPIELVEKSGGRSGHFVRQADIDQP
ncbi:MAG: cyclic pyranopterin monophosphate synthase MoaC [Candidatus Alcyoniella australis]|nr:cyclic pyranopterin monophosphate synthase MoaC [Candidatus Alcyoniella australis]